MLLLSSCGLPTAAAPHPCCVILLVALTAAMMTSHHYFHYTTTIPRILQFDGPDDLFVVVIDIAGSGNELTNHHLVSTYLIWRLE